MTELRIGHFRVFTVDPVLTAQQNSRDALDVDRRRIYRDDALAGTSRNRPGLRRALAACRQGDTLVVTKLDRPTESLPVASDIVDEPTTAASDGTATSTPTGV